MKLAIVGSTCLKDNFQALMLIHKILQEKQPSIVMSGGAEGIDSMVADTARLYDIEVIEYLPEKPRWYWYKKRNLLIAQNCDELVRIVGRCSKTYGSGWTRDRAKELGKPTEEYVI